MLHLRPQAHTAQAQDHAGLALSPAPSPTQPFRCADLIHDDAAADDFHCTSPHFTTSPRPPQRRIIHPVSETTTLLPSLLRVRTHHRAPSYPRPYYTFLRRAHDTPPVHALPCRPRHPRKHGTSHSPGLGHVLRLHFLHLYRYSADTFSTPTGTWGKDRADIFRTKPHPQNLYQSQLPRPIPTHK